jgi:hypothetical protein
MKRWLFVVSAFAAGIIVAALVLSAILVFNGSGSSGVETVSQEEAVEIARVHAPSEMRKAQARFIQRADGREVWAVNLFALDDQGNVTRSMTVVVDATTGFALPPPLAAPRRSRPSG